MSQSDFTYRLAAGERRGIKYLIGVRHDPSINNVDSFAAILFFPLDDGTRIEVAKIDDSAHDGERDIHIDRYYREIGADVKDFDPDIEDWMDAEEYLRENWERLVDTYFQNHGAIPRMDAKNI